MREACSGDWDLAGKRELDRAQALRQHGQQQQPGTRKMVRPQDLGLPRISPQGWEAAEGGWWLVV